jgi:hypothetical protein
MPVTYHIDPILRVVFTILEGIVTSDEALDHEERLRKDPAFEPSFRQLADCRQITEVRATGSTIRFVAVMSPFSRETRRAIVVEQDFIYGLARMYQTLKDGAQIRVFRDVGEAWLWLSKDSS